MNRSLIVAACTLVTVAGIAQAKKPVTAAKPAVKTATAANLFKNNTDSVSYAVGIRMVQSLKAQGFDNVNVSLLQKAISDVTQNRKPLLTDADIYKCMGEFQQKVAAVKDAEAKKEIAAKSGVNRKEGAEFLANNAKRAGVITLPSGLQYEILKAGTDNTTRPTLASTVKVHYTGTLLNGTKFDSSVDRGQPITFPLTNVIQGWQQAVQLMTVGSKWKLYIPADLAYGDYPQPGGAITPGATLVFEVELLGIEN